MGTVMVVMIIVMRTDTATKPKRVLQTVKNMAMIMQVMYTAMIKNMQVMSMTMHSLSTTMAIQSNTNIAMLSQTVMLKHMLKMRMRQQPMGTMVTAI